MPLVSIIIPTQTNRACCLEACLKSIRGQTYSDYEAIVISDGPNQMARRISREILGNKCVFLETASSAAEARNAGIWRSSGEFIALLDDDDVWHPLKLEEQAAFLESSPAIVMTYSNYGYINAHGKRIYPDFSEKKWRIFKRGDAKFKNTIKRIWHARHFPKTSTVMVRRKAAFRLRLFDAVFRRTHEDSDFYLRLQAVYGHSAMYWHQNMLAWRRLSDFQASRRIVPNNKDPEINMELSLDEAVFNYKIHRHIYCGGNDRACALS
ncbi:MAG: glycosyltransferase family 2 protein [Elusimicrobiota bacterium]